MSCLFDKSSQNNTISVPKSTSNSKRSQKTQTISDANPSDKVNQKMVCNLKNLQENSLSRLTEIEKEIHSLNEAIALALPERIAAKKAIRQSAAAIKLAAEDMKDKELRSKNVIIWGKFTSYSSKSPVDTVSSILSPFFNLKKFPIYRATWLRSKASKKPSGIIVTLPTSLPAAEVVTKRQLILSLHPIVTGVSLDRPVTQRKHQRQTETKPPRAELETGKTQISPHLNPVVMLEDILDHPEHFKRPRSSTPSQIATASANSSFLTVDSLPPTPNEPTSLDHELKLTPKASYAEITKGNKPTLHTLKTTQTGLLGPPPIHKHPFFKVSKQTRPPERKRKPRNLTTKIPTSKIPQQQTNQRSTKTIQPLISPLTPSLSQMKMDLITLLIQSLLPNRQ